MREINMKYIIPNATKEEIEILGTWTIFPTGILSLKVINCISRWHYTQFAEHKIRMTKNVFLEVCWQKLSTNSLLRVQKEHSVHLAKTIERLYDYMIEEIK